MNLQTLKKRIEKLDKKEHMEQIEVIRVIIKPDGSIVGVKKRPSFPPQRNTDLVAG